MLRDIGEDMYDSNELNYELLYGNGLPLKLQDGTLSLKTSSTNYSDEVYTFVDIETNGSNPLTSSIIEIGAIKVYQNEIVDKFMSFAYVSEIPEFITKITGITQSDVATSPRVQEVLSEFRVFLEDSIFVAHDVKFDYNFISTLLSRYNLGKLLNRKFCTIALSKKVFNYEKYGLGYLNSALDINIDNHHRAYNDALISYKIFQKAIQKVPIHIKTTEDLIRFSK